MYTIKNNKQISRNQVANKNEKKIVYELHLTSIKTYQNHRNIGIFDTPNTQFKMIAPFPGLLQALKKWQGETSFPQISRINIMMRSCKCSLHVIKMSTLTHNSLSSVVFKERFNLEYIIFCILHASDKILFNKAQISSEKLQI